MIKIKSFLFGCTVMPLFAIASQMPDQFVNAENSSPDNASVIRQKKRRLAEIKIDAKTLGQEIANYNKIIDQSDDATLANLAKDPEFRKLGETLRKMRANYSE